MKTFFIRMQLPNNSYSHAWGGSWNVYSAHYVPGRAAACVRLSDWLAREPPLKSAASEHAPNDRHRKSFSSFCCALLLFCCCAPPLMILIIGGKGENGWPAEDEPAAEHASLLLPERRRRRTQAIPEKFTDLRLEILVKLFRFRLYYILLLLRICAGWKRWKFSTRN